MTRETILMIIGVLVLLSPWSGLPLAWLEWALPVLGLVVIGIGVTLRSRNSPSVPTAAPSTLPDEPAPRSSHIAFS